jgi:hypothetical protein
MTQILIFLFFFFTPAFAGTEGMPSMPIAKPKLVFTVTGKENFEETRGFGKDADRVKMMNLMMVGGSEYEGMEMTGHHHHDGIESEKTEDSE